MKFKISAYDVQRNQFEIDCRSNPEYDRFDPFVSAITNGDEYRDFNESMVGKTLELSVYPHGRCLLLTADGEKEYKTLTP